jgi:ribonuclease HI
MVDAIYADGGVIQKNPSDIGGTWATCHVDGDNRRCWRASGVLLPADVGAPFVTNNQTEFYALLTGLEMLATGWSGKVCTDSLVTIRRFRDEGRLAGIPNEWRRRMAMTLGRLGELEYVLLDGHPTRAQLAAGIGKRGGPVSEHNVWCDHACTEAGRELVGRRALERVGL